MWPTIGTIVLAIALVVVCVRYEKEVKLLILENEELKTIIREKEEELRKVRRGE